MMENGNYGRFYALLHRMPYEGNRDDLKEVLVKTYTQCRTGSLHNMTRAEYDRMCRRMEDELGLADEHQRWRDELRRHRSACLRLMQRLGIDTTDWARVNDFCRHPRICGKEFARLGTDELTALQRKLRAIQRNGGMGHRMEQQAGGGSKPEAGKAACTCFVMVQNVQEGGSGVLS